VIAMTNPSKPYAGKTPQEPRQVVKSNDDCCSSALSRFLVRMYVQVAARKLAEADELREAAAKAGKARR
jgi:hypothetical protein